MFATTFALLNSNYNGRDRGVAYGLWGAVAGASAAIGPIIGGLLTEAISWRWIFFVNLPISVAAIVMCMVVLRDAHAPHRARVDIAGIVLFTGAAALVTYALIRANEDGWGSLGTWLLLAGGAVVLALFTAVESRTEYAMLDLALLKNKSFVGVIVGAGLMNFAAFASFTYTSIWLQSVLGLSPIDAGLTGLPLSLAAFVVSAAGGKLLAGRAPGKVIGTGLLLIGAGGLVGALLVHGSATWPALIPGFLIIGVGVGLAMPTLSSSAMSAVPVQRGGMAAGAVNTSRQLGFAFGIALLGSVFSARVQSVLNDHGVPHASTAAHLVAGGQAYQVLDATPSAGRAAVEHALKVASVAGVQGTFLVGGIVGVLAGLLVLVLVRPAPTARSAGQPADTARSRANGSADHAAVTSGEPTPEASPA
jgi:MFS family permease